RLHPTVIISLAANTGTKRRRGTGSGNAAEWVADWYENDFYISTRIPDPTDPSKGSYKIVRGGY
ncbi:MAG: hypothetical protein WBF05_15030, partial [Anaerolineales bacterium]